MWDWHLASGRMHFSPRWLSLVGCAEHEVGNTSRAWLQRVHPEDVAQVSQALDALVGEGPAELELRHRLLHKDGTYKWVSCRAVVQRDAAGQPTHVVGTHADVTAATVSDPMTGLPNRLLFVEHVTRSIDRAVRYQGFHFAVLCINLDRQATEGFADLAADAALTAAARRLETCLRVSETPPTLRHNDLVARLGGDQFAVLLDGLKDVAHATVAADRILGAILTPFMLGGREVRLSASIGIAVSASGYARAEDVVRDADTAAHRAKLLGGTRCEIFDTAVLKAAQAELQLEADFSGALERDEFVLAYQPIASLVSNQIAGFEALVRWRHPVLGLIGPLEFIPLAERTGFIVPLGQWVLREACRQLKAWQVSLPISTELWVSVNLSSRQFRSPTLVEEIGEVLRECGLEPRSLILELTEGIAMENPTAARTLLLQMRALGVRVSVDDFGTGHSSLAYLRQFPLHSLKVDRSFVRGIEANQDLATIVRAVTTMARQLGLHVVAEGVENADQLALLRSLGCEFGQGYLFSRPVDPESAAALLATGLPPQAASVSAEEPTALAPGLPQMPSPRIARPLTASQWLYSAAAAAALVMSVGLPRMFSGPGPRMERVSSAGPEDGGPPALATPGADITLAPPADAPAARTERSEPALPASPAHARDPRSDAREAKPSTASSAFHVVHQHRLGSCRGQLVVTRDGVAYVPDDAADQGKDAFSLKYAQFIQELVGDSLTIKSNNRDYRFKAAGASATDRDQLQQVVAAITRLR